MEHCYITQNMYVLYVLLKMFWCENYGSVQCIGCLMIN